MALRGLLPFYLRSKVATEWQWSGVKSEIDVRSGGVRHSALDRFKHAAEGWLYVAAVVDLFSRRVISRTASSLNSRVNFRLFMTHLQLHQNT